MSRQLAWLTLTTTIACGTDDTNTTASAPTYYGEAKAIVDTRCANCHVSGGIGPFPLTTYEEVRTFAGPVQASIENDTMPPWKPSDDCNSYVGNIDLTGDEKEILLSWLDADAPEGDPDDFVAPAAEEAAFTVDMSLQLPEPYTPTREPDDYRCQLIPWPSEETRFVTGLRVAPDQAAIVHHVIAFVVRPDQVPQFMAYDAAEEGPGYTCYGGPTASSSEGGLEDIDVPSLMATLEELGLSLADLQAGNITPDQFNALMAELGISGGFSSLGSWVPGVPANPYPEGTGIRMEPGSMLAVQMHYNTSSADPVPDQSTIEIATTDAVEREATNLAVLDFGWVTNGLLGDPMSIPAGESYVAHETTATHDSPLFSMARENLGLDADASLVVHNANHHMHELGTSQRSEVHHADGSTSCLLDIPDWDFAWQGAYSLSEPVTVRPGDAIWMGCTWNNSAENQPVIDGEVKEPADVVWGEGTSDEMCLGGFYVTAE